MKNLLDDPEVMQLYKDLQNNRFSSVDEYLEINPAEEFNSKPKQEIYKPKLKEAKMWFDGEQVPDFIGDNDYGL